MPRISFFGLQEDQDSLIKKRESDLKHVDKIVTLVKTIESTFSSILKVDIGKNATISPTDEITLAKITDVLKEDSQNVGLENLCKKFYLTTDDPNAFVALWLALLRGYTLSMDDAVRFFALTYSKKNVNQMGILLINATVQFTNALGLLIENEHATDRVLFGSNLDLTAIREYKERLINCLKLVQDCADVDMDLLIFCIENTRFSENKVKQATDYFTKRNFLKPVEEKFQSFLKKQGGWGASAEELKEIMKDISPASYYRYKYIEKIDGHIKIYYGDDEKLIENEHGYRRDNPEYNERTRNFIDGCLAKSCLDYLHNSAGYAATHPDNILVSYVKKRVQEIHSVYQNFLKKKIGNNSVISVGKSHYFIGEHNSKKILLKLVEIGDKVVLINAEKENLPEGLNFDDPNLVEPCHQYSYDGTIVPDKILKALSKALNEGTMGNHVIQSFVSRCLNKLKSSGLANTEAYAHVLRHILSLVMYIPMHKIIEWHCDPTISSQDKQNSEKQLKYWEIDPDLMFGTVSDSKIYWVSSIEQLDNIELKNIFIFLENEKLEQSELFYYDLEKNKKRILIKNVDSFVKLLAHYFGYKIQWESGLVDVMYIDVIDNNEYILLKNKFVNNSKLYHVNNIKTEKVQFREDVNTCIDLFTQVMGGSNLRSLKKEEVWQLIVPKGTDFVTGIILQKITNDWPAQDCVLGAMMMFVAGTEKRAKQNLELYNSQLKKIKTPFTKEVLEQLPQWHLSILRCFQPDNMRDTSFFPFVLTDMESMFYSKQAQALKGLFLHIVAAPKLNKKLQKVNEQLNTKNKTLLEKKQIVENKIKMIEKTIQQFHSENEKLQKISIELNIDLERLKANNSVLEGSNLRLKEGNVNKVYADQINTNQHQINESVKQIKDHEPKIKHNSDLFKMNLKLLEEKQKLLRECKIQYDFLTNKISENSKLIEKNELTILRNDILTTNTKAIFTNPSHMRSVNSEYALTFIEFIILTKNQDALTYIHKHQKELGFNIKENEFINLVFEAAVKLGILTTKSMGKRSGFVRFLCNLCNNPSSQLIRDAEERFRGLLYNYGKFVLSFESRSDSSNEEQSLLIENEETVLKTT